MKRIGIVSTLLLVALLALGVGLARWTDSLSINGYVHTGELSTAIGMIECYDDEPTGKDYSWIEAVPDEEDPNKLWVTVYNGYPSITYTCLFSVINDGTIPLHVDGVWISELPEFMDVEVTGFNENGPTQIHPNGSETGMLTVHFDNDAEENETYTFEVSIDVGQWNLPPENENDESGNDDD